MNVEQAMTTGVKTCRPQDALSTAAHLMWDHDCGCVPVVDEKLKVLGIITDRDICMAAYTQGKPLYELPVSLAMSKNVWSVRPGDTISAAELVMQEHQIRRLPVVDVTGRLVGLLSLNDLARHASRERTQKRKAVSDAEIGETLAAICEATGCQEAAAVSAA